MNWETISEAIWAVLNSHVGLATAAAVYIWLFRRWVTPRWAAYEGAIIAAIRFAEKQIPDDAPNKSLARLDAALNYVLRVYEQVTGDVADAHVRNDFCEGIQRIHHKLEREGAI